MEASQEDCRFFTGVKLQYTATLIATLTIFTSGSHMVWTSPSLPKLYEDNSTIKTTITDGSLMGSLSLIANLPSSPIAAMSADYFGRKPVLHLTPLLYLLGWLLIAYAKTVIPILIAKVIVGIGDGSIHTVLPMYIGEIADDDNRGSLGLCSVMMLDLGILYTYAVGPLLSIQNMALVSSIFPILTLCTFIFMPESPYYYLMKGKHMKAKITLIKLRGTKNVDTEFNEMQKSITESIILNKSRWKDLCITGTNLKSLLILIGVTSLQQFSGISVVLIYSELIFQHAGGPFSHYYGPVLIGTVQLLTDVVALSIVDLVPRRSLLFVSCVACFVALLAQSTYFILNHAYTWLPIVNMVVYIIGYSLGLGPIPVVLSTELFATNIKAKGMAILDNYSDFTGFFTALAFQFVAESWGYHVPFMCFTIATGFGILFVKFFVPETKGLSLEEIQQNLQHRSASEE